LGVGIAALALLVIGGMFFALSRIQYRVQVVGGRVEVVPVSTEAVTPTPAVALVATPTGEAALGTSTPTPTVSPTNTPTVTRTPIPPTLTPTLVSPTPTPVPPTPTLTPVPPTSTPVPPTPTSFGRIVYSDGKTGNDEIYVANSDGSDEQRLTDHAGGDWLPTWSPDGTRIVFCSDHHAIGEDRNQLYVMDADGSNLTRLTYTEGNDEHPSWSPDGSRIAFHSNCGLAVINADGSNWTTLVEGGEGLCVRRPTWSPDSWRIAFKSIWPSHHRLPGPYQHDIYVVNDNGAGLSKLATFTSEEWGGWYAVWSPDGSQVAFDIVLDDQERYYAVNSDSSGEPMEIPSIPDSWYPCYWPQWSGEE
jgi:hypothetical protein